MKVSELPENTNLTKVKVRLPKDVLKKYKEYAGGEKEMYIVGSMMGDFFLSPTIKKERRLYPMPLGVIPEDILNWEVVENNN